MIKVAICTPVRLHIYHEAPFCAMKAATLLSDSGFEQQYFYLPGSALLEHTRSIIAHDALEWGAEVLLWIDDDVTFNPSEALKLVRGALATRSLVAGVCALRSGDKVNVNFQDQIRGYRFYTGGEVVKVTHAGLGMTAIHRDVYDLLAQDMPQDIVIYDKIRTPYYRSQFWDKTWPGEDFSFSRLMQEYGLQSYADTNVRAVHHGDYGFRIEDVINPRVPDQETLEVKGVEE